MRGGAPKIIPSYTQTTDTFKQNIPNEQKDIFVEKMKSKPPFVPKENPPTYFLV